MIHKISKQRLNKLLSQDIPRITNLDRDGMAIPSYLHWNPLIRWLMWRRYEQISYLAGFSRDKTVLEFGCGIGLFLQELAAKCNTVYAIDIFPEYAKLLSEELDLHVCFKDNISEIQSASLDIVIAADVLEHLQDTELDGLLEIFSEKLKSNGQLLVSGPTESIVYKIGRVLAGFVDKGDYHHTNIDNLINTISKYFDLKCIITLPYRFPPYLFKVCEFKQCLAKHSS